MPVGAGADAHGLPGCGVLHGVLGELDHRLGDPLGVQLGLDVGHLGELLPFNVWRTDHRVAVAPRGIDIQHSFGHYLRNNFYLTTSGNFRTPALLNTIQEVGADRLLFSADYPFEDMREAADWFDRLEINDNDHVKIARTNAQALLKL